MMQRVTDKNVRAHVFFTTEGYDDFRKVVNENVESETPVPFDFASGLTQKEYNAKLKEWSDFRKLPNDRELLEYISELG